MASLEEALKRLNDLPENEDDLSETILETIDRENSPITRGIRELEEREFDPPEVTEEPENPRGAKPDRQEQPGAETPANNTVLDPGGGTRPEDAVESETLQEPSFDPAQAVRVGRTGGVKEGSNLNFGGQRSAFPPFDPELEKKLEGSGIEESAINPLEAALVAATGGAFAAWKLGASGARMVAQGLVSGGAAGLTDVPIGIVVETVAEKYPFLALPAAVVLGLLVGAKIEVPLERMALKRGSSILGVFRDLFKRNRSAGKGLKESYEDAMESTLVQAAKEDPEGLAELDKAARAAHADDVAARQAPTASGFTKEQEAVFSARNEELKTAFQMTGDELDAAVKTAKETEATLDVSILGKEKAARLKKLDRLAKSSDTAKADKAADEIEELLSSIPIEQRNRLEGIGETSPSAETLDRIKRGIQDLETVENAEDLAQTLAFDLIKVGNKTDFSQMTFEQQLAFARLNRANQLLAEKGLDTKAISDRAIEIAAAQFSDPNDALFILRRFIKPEGGETEAAQSFRRIKAPKSEEGVPSPPTPKHKRVEIKEGTEAEIDAFLKTEPDASRVTGKNRAVKFAVDGMSNEEVNSIIDRFRKVRDADFEAARRGEIDPETGRAVLTDEAVKGLAAKLKMSVADFLAMGPGTNLNVEQASLFESFIGAIQKDLRRLVGEVEAGNPGALEEFNGQFGNLMLTFQRLGGFRAESGRTQRIWGKDADGNIAFLNELGRAVEETGDAKLDTLDLVTMFKSLDADQQLRFVRIGASQARKRMDLLINVWLNSLLSGPRTHTKNFEGNLLKLAFRIPVRARAAQIDDSVAVGEATQMLYGITGAWRDALGVLAHGFRTGEPLFKASKFTGSTSDRAIEQFEVKNTFDAAALAIAHTMKFVGRSMTGVDNFSKMLSYQAELRARAFREGVEKGLEDVELAEFISKRMETPMLGAKRSAQTQAIEDTFQEDLGAVGKKAQELFDHPALKVIVPFFKVTTNMPLQTFKTFPFLNRLMPSVRRELAAGGSRAALVKAQAQVGGALMALSSLFTMGGFMTGAGPKTKEEREQLRLATPGWQPFSIRIPTSFIPGVKTDTWVEYVQWGPVGMSMGLAADFTENVGRLTQDPEHDGITAEEIAMAIFLPFRNVFLRQSFLMGVAQWMAAISMPQSFGPRTLSRFVGSLVPGGSLFRQFNDSFVTQDMRDVRTALDAMLVNLPFGSALVPPLRNELGDKVNLNHGFGQGNIGPFFRFIAPANISRSKAEKDVIGDELARLQKILAKPFVGQAARNIGGVGLSPREYETYKEEIGKGEVPDGGRTLKADLLEMINDSWYKEQSPTVQAEELARIVHDARKAAKRRMIGDPFSGKGSVSPDFAERFQEFLNLQDELKKPTGGISGIGVNR